MNTLTVSGRVVVTGVSSLTGAAIADALSHAGHSVLAMTGSPESAYTGLKKYRLSHLSLALERSFGVEFSQPVFAEIVAAYRPDLFVFHHHSMVNWRTDQYDLQATKAAIIDPIPALLDRLKKGCRVIYSSSIAEPGEGGKARLDAPTKYAVSKKETYLALKKECEKRNLLLSRIVIPNPVGPAENTDRLIPLLLQHAIAGKALELKNPFFTSDSLPVGDIAQSYVTVAQHLLQGKTAEVRPSGWVVSVEEFCKTVNAELIEKRLGLKPCELVINNTVAQVNRIQNEPAFPIAVNLQAFFDEYAAWLKINQALYLP